MSEALADQPNLHTHRHLRVTACVDDQGVTAEDGLPATSI